MYAFGHMGDAWRGIHRIERVPPESALKWFHLRCALCGSYRVRLRLAHDESAGEVKLVFHCAGCHREEAIGGIEPAM